MNESVIKELLARAASARLRAYAPYSNFFVGCAVLLNDGQIIEGVNIENASYPVAICAERAAMATIISAGLAGQIKALAVITNVTPPGSPCGMCRQFLSEFLDEKTPIFLGNPQGDVVKTTMAELLPLAFTKSALR